MQPSMVFMLLGGVTIASSCAIPNAGQTKNFNGNQQQTKLPEVSIDHPNPESKSQLNAEEDIELFRMVPQSTTIPREDLAPTRSTISNREQKKTSNGNNGEKNIPEVSTEITIPEPKSQLNAEEDIELFRMVPQRTTVPIEDLASEKIVPLPTRSPTPRTYTILNGEQKKTSNGATEITISEPKTQLNAEEDIELFRMVPQSTTIPREDLGSEKIVPLPTRSSTPQTYTILNGEQKKTSSEENKLPEVATSEPKTQLNAEEDIELFQSTTTPKVEKIVPLPTRSPTPGTAMITSTSHEENQGTQTTEVMPINIMPLPMPGNVSVECEVQPYSFGPRLSAQLLKILTRLG